MKSTNYDLILLFSGGLDSTLLLAMASEMSMRPLCILFDYGQHHVEELEYAVKTCDDYNAQYLKFKIGLPVDSKLTGDSKTYEGVSEWHVPSRNLIFMSMAVSVAEDKGIPLIWFGANYEDREKLFPDCYQEWIYSLNQLLSINGSMKIKVEAPLLGMSKETIKQLAHYYSINEKDVFSGYGK